VVAELAAVDPDAAELVRQWASIAAPGPGPDHNERASLGIVERLAQHVLGVDGFFEWSSEREVVAT
jgi:hypothetical protein